MLERYSSPNWFASSDQTKCKINNIQSINDKSKIQVSYGSPRDHNLRDIIDMDVTKFDGGAIAARTGTVRILFERQVR